MSVEANTSHTSDKAILVCALYKFVTLDDYEELQASFLDQLNQRNIRGTLLLASEGINGTIAGTPEMVKSFLDWLTQDKRFSDIECKFSTHSAPPFYRTKVKLKKEIVTMGVENIDPNKVVGTYVDPSEWNELISDPDVLLIDTRNTYEVDIGTFKNALNPQTESFREFPDYVANNLDPSEQKKVAMFCTGGIRCEKASAFMKQQGFEDVFHLKGGILKYLEQIEPENSLWNGECFVFDDRVAVNQELKQGQYDQCHACRHPITEEDKLSAQYIPGVSCHLCYDKLTDQQKARFEERERQVQLAKIRGHAHIGADSKLAAESNRDNKRAAKQQQRNNVSKA